MVIFFFIPYLLEDSQYIFVNLSLYKITVYNSSCHYRPLFGELTIISVKYTEKLPVFHFKSRNKLKIFTEGKETANFKLKPGIYSLQKYSL